MDVRVGKPYSRHIFQFVFYALKIALCGVVILSCIYAVNQIKLSRYFPIKQVEVFGVNRVDRQEVQALIQPLVNRGFFTINVELIRDRLLQMPWVSNTFVRRAWPDQIKITVIEKMPVARWNEHSLLSEAGELFSPKQATYPSHLPTFIGPEGKQIEMLQYYNEINRILDPLHARISLLELTPYSTWKVTMNNGISLQLGHKDILTRLGHFVKVYPKIVGSRAAEVDYIDLRYSNGIAVRWKANAGAVSLKVEE